MKLYIKQRVFSIGDKYDVYDEYQNPVFQVQSEIFTLAAKIHINDNFGNEIYYIQRKVFSFMAQYEIYHKGVLSARLKQNFSFFRGKLSIESEYGDFQIEGNLIGHEYVVYQNGRVLGSVLKKWLSWSDVYELTITDQNDAAFFAAVVIAIDNCLHNDKK